MPVLAEVRKIAFVSQRFLELQGLIPAVFGGAIVLAAVMNQALGGGTSGSATPILLFWMLAGSTPATALLQRSYKRTFGDLVATRTQRFLAILQTTVIYAGVMIDLFLASRGHAAGPSFAALALMAYSSAVIVRDWPYRSHHVIALAAGIAATYVTASVPSAPDRWLDALGNATHLLAYTLIGLGLVVTGLFDHQLLASALRPGAAAGRIHVSPLPVTIVRTTFAAAVCATAALFLQIDPRWIVVGFPTTLMVVLLSVCIVIAIAQIVRAVREFPNVRPPAMPEVRVDGHATASMAAVALAAGLQAVLLPHRPPVLLHAAVAVACAWLALSNWRDRRAYALVTAAAVAAMPFVLRASAARGFLVSVFAISAGFFLHGVDAWRRSSAREDVDADTV